MPPFLFSDIRDIHDVIEITVWDEDKDHKYEFLGKVLVPLLYCTVLYCTVLYCTVQVLVPLLRVRNGERRWFKLKDKTLRQKAKGEDAEILLEMNLLWNP